jgi:hypothetical protein
MITANDNPGQGNRGGQETGDGNLHKSQRNQDSQRHETTPDEEKLRKAQEQDKIEQEENEEDKFSPGEPDGYDAEDFATD